MKIKLKEGFVLRQVADTWVVMAIGETMMDFNGMMTLNETGMFLWKAVGEGEELSALVSSLMMEYNVTKEQADADVKEYCDKLVEIGCAEYIA